MKFGKEGWKRVGRITFTLFWMALIYFGMIHGEPNNIQIMGLLAMMAVVLAVNYGEISKNIEKKKQPDTYEEMSLPGKIGHSFLIVMSLVGLVFSLVAFWWWLDMVCIFLGGTC